MIEILATTVLPSLVPAVVDTIRGVVAKVTGSAGGRPQNVEETIQLMNAETERLKALADIDKPSGKASQWVTDLRESSRYIATFLILLMAFVLVVMNSPHAQSTLNIGSSAFFFLFGDRVYLHIKKNDVVNTKPK